MRFYFLIVVSLLIFSISGCKEISIIKPNNDSTKPIANPQAEKELEEHDTYKPWWSFN